jgi:hypothetical protein
MGKDQSGQPKALSIRMSDAFFRKVHEIARLKGTTVTEVVRSAVESGRNAQALFRAQYTQLICTDAAVKGTVHSIYQRIEGDANPILSAEECAAVLYLIHGAYQKSSHYYINVNYAEEVIDLAADLISELFAIDGEDRMTEYLGRLAGENSAAQTVGEARALAIAQTKEYPFGGGMEGRMRVLVWMADYVDRLHIQARRCIFDSDRIRRVLPLLSLYADQLMQDSMITDGMAEILPDAEEFNVGNLQVLLSPEPFLIHITGRQHEMLLGPRTLMSMASLAETFDGRLDSTWCWKGRGLEILPGRGGLVLFDNTNPAYRVYVPTAEFLVLVEQVERIFTNKRWAWLLKRYRLMKGDI